MKKFILLAILAITTPTSFGQGTAFTYQGRLNNNGAVANGSYDLQFALFDAAVGGNLIGGALTNNAVAVSNGLFMVTLDFGAGVFTGVDRWLLLSVKTNGAVNFMPLVPRQQITATPYAITAGNLAGTLPASQVSGVISVAQLPGAVVTNGASGVNLAGTFTGNGAGLTNVNAATPGLESSLGFVNITNYGAVADGVTDNSAAIARACTNAVVFIPPSASGFVISNTIFLSNNCRIFGLGKSSLILKHTNSTGYAFDASNGHTLQVLNVRLNGGMATNCNTAQNGTTNSYAMATRGALALYNNLDSFVDHCEFLNFPGFGIRVIGDLDNEAARRGAARIDNCAFTNVFAGILFNSLYGEYASSRDCVFVRCYIGANISCGNVYFTGTGHDNYIALGFFPGVGRVHGNFSGMFNHNGLAAVYMFGADSTALFHDCVFAGGGDIYLLNTTGQCFDNVRFNGVTITTTGSTTNTFTNCKLSTTPTLSGPGTVFRWNNRLDDGSLWGPGFDFANALTVNSVYRYTNLNTLAPNFNVEVSRLQTNAAFNFAAATGVDTTRTLYQKTTVFVTNSTASAVAVTATPPIRMNGTAYVTNLTRFVFETYAQQWTNCHATPFF